jgi:hypothetical protein
MVQLSATNCRRVAILWVSLVNFSTITLCIASQRVFIVVSVYFVIDSVRKLVVTPSYNSVRLEKLRKTTANLRIAGDGVGIDDGVSWTKILEHCCYTNLLANNSKPNEGFIEWFIKTVERYSLNVLHFNLLRESFHVFFSVAHTTSFAKQNFIGHKWFRNERGVKEKVYPLV